MYGNASTIAPTKKKDDSKLKRLLRELSDDEDNGPPVHAPPANPTKPWLAGYQLYLDTQDHLGGMSLVVWWGVSIHSLCVACL
jgi:hypothetical protein